EDISKAKKVYDPRIVAGMEQGYVALYQKCVHLGCRVPWCESSQWFECPCHGSKYNRVGEKKGGPAPRGLDRFVLQVSGGEVTVAPSESALGRGPPIAPDPAGQTAGGGPCVWVSHAVNLRLVLIIVNLVAFATIGAIILWGVFSLRRTPEPRPPQNLT